MSDMFVEEVLQTIIILIILYKYAVRKGGFRSNPVVGAAIGNAANRHFENSQVAVEGISQTGQGQFGFYDGGKYPSAVPFGFPQITNRGYQSDGAQSAIQVITAAPYPNAQTGFIPPKKYGSSNIPLSKKNPYFGKA